MKHYRSLVTWNGENNTEIAGYEMRKKKKATIQDSWLVSPIVAFFNQEITSDPRGKEIMIMMIIIIRHIIIIRYIYIYI